MYRERTTPDITIYRPTLSGTATEVQTVPITEASKRVFSLMSEDYVELHFTLAEAVAFEVGDYIDDEIFGRFVITAKQMPSYDTSTGGYDYTLKFEREYRKWKNRKLMLTATITAEDGTVSKRVRKEANWTLTANLRTHAEEIINNINAIGDTAGGSPYTLNLGGTAYADTYSLKDFAAGSDTLSWSGVTVGVNAVDDTVEVSTAPAKADEVKNLSYEGTDIISALTAIADAYECEWWVTYDEAGKGTLHFGKCEDYDTDETVLSLETNVESMTIQDDNQTYCNRLYAFGASTNVPSSYRKTLEFTVADKADYNMIDFPRNTYFLPDRQLTLDMLFGGTYGTLGFKAHKGSSTSGSTSGSFVGSTSGSSVDDTDDTFGGNRYNNDITPSYTSNAVLFKRTSSDSGNYTWAGATWQEDCNAFTSNGGSFTFSGQFLFSGQLTLSTTGSTRIKGSLSIKATVSLDVVGSDGKTVGSVFAESSTIDFTFDRTGAYGNLLPSTAHTFTADFEDKKVSVPSGYYHLVLNITYEIPTATTDSGTTYTAKPSNDNSITAGGSATKAESCVEAVNGTTVKHGRVCIGTDKTDGWWEVTFRKMSSSPSYGDWADRVIFSFDTNSKLAANKLAKGDKFLIDYYDGQQGLWLPEIPLSWFATEYDDPSALCQIGDNRLMLPVETGGYLQPDTDLTRDQIVEMAATFNEIYPRCVLRVTSVTEEEKRQKEEYEDDSKTYWNWTQYKLTAQTLDGQSFTFNKSFIKSGETLQIKFLSEKEAQEAWGEMGQKGTYTDGEYRLAGMTFDVNFKNLSQLYTIVRNEDYGALLPNDTLRPAVGDPFILVGWDVRALNMTAGGLGIIEAAEKRLQEAAEEYMDAIKADQFTFTCNMMSDAPERIGVPLYDKPDRPFYEAAPLPFYVKSAGRYYSLLLEGARACVRHNALSTEESHGLREKHSRVIGYQFKLDMPFDSPQYTIGETDAYSRIKKMEKEITKLGGS